MKTRTRVQLIAPAFHSAYSQLGRIDHRVDCASSLSRRFFGKHPKHISFGYLKPYHPDGCRVDWFEGTSVSQTASISAVARPAYRFIAAVRTVLEVKRLRNSSPQYPNIGSNLPRNLRQALESDPSIYLSNRSNFTRVLAVVFLFTN